MPKQAKKCVEAKAKNDFTIRNNNPFAPNNFFANWSHRKQQIITQWSVNRESVGDNIIISSSNQSNIYVGMQAFYYTIVPSPSTIVTYYVMTWPYMNGRFETFHQADPAIGEVIEVEWNDIAVVSRRRNGEERERERRGVMGDGVYISWGWNQMVMLGGGVGKAITLFYKNWVTVY